MHVVVYVTGLQECVQLCFDLRGETGL
jgi:hypothetical protein